MTSSNPYYDLRQKLGSAPQYIPSQPSSYPGSSAPKYTAGDVATLVNLIVDKQRSIDYNPDLTYSQGAEKYLRKRKLADKGYSVLSGDFDNDVNTPDNVIVLDKDGVPRIVDGYSIGTGRKRRTAAVFGSRKDVYKALEGDILKKQYKKYLRSKEGRDTGYQDFQGWNAAHPYKESNYTTLQKYFSTRLSKILTSIGLSKEQVNYIPLLSEVLKDVIGMYRKENPNVKKLTKQDYEKIASFPLEGNSSLNGLIGKYLKNPNTGVKIATDPFSETPLSYGEFQRGTPTVRTKARAAPPRTMNVQNPSFIPPLRDQLLSEGGLPDDSNLFGEEEEDVNSIIDRINSS